MSDPLALGEVAVVVGQADDGHGVVRGQFLPQQDGQFFGGGVLVEQRLGQQGDLAFVGQPLSEHADESPAVGADAAFALQGEPCHGRHEFFHVAVASGRGRLVDLAQHQRGVHVQDALAGLGRQARSRA
ncbi:hypothetical protein [Streptomyces pseudovenezuelae]|uniref:Uncharacterized protein n=1 Tax=Streptomyces pseudovenezuelae TaxID=67350 RepID=A0ABT6LDW6_9ACTN|nr:hypothetical protein [Streptomyces pseudovenezuelae]